MNSLDGQPLARTVKNGALGYGYVLMHYNLIIVIHFGAPLQYMCVCVGCVCGCGFRELTWVVDDSEKMEVIFKNHFITILFPVDRFGEMGPSSRTFFSDSGFTCSQLLDHIYAFYQVGSRR